MERESSKRERRDPSERPRHHSSRSSHSHHHHRRDISRRHSQRPPSDEPLRPSRVRPRERVVSDPYNTKWDALNQQLGWDQKPSHRRDHRHSGFSEKHSGSSGTKRSHHRVDAAREDEYQHKRRVSGRPLLDPEKQFNGQANQPRQHHRRGPDVERNAVRNRRKRRWKWLIALSILALLALIIGLAVGIPLSRKNHGSSTEASPTTSPSPSSNADTNGGPPKQSIPAFARGTYYDPSTWLDTTDFNLTFTEQKVGGLPIMGLFTSYDDNTRANPSVPPLTTKWNYGQTPIRGMNIGGWLSIEPFITPSLFSNWSASANVVDEWSLCATLGPRAAAYTLEKHYSSFVTEDTFASIAAAGFDHVRLCFSYWAVTTYPGDPYVPMISWRYLLRGIEWARKYGLRVNLDLHGVPGSQNGNNHSGRQGVIGWLNGTNGELNADRTLDIHRQLSTFFAQPRYANIVTLYGLVNEPRMVELNVTAVLNWTSAAIAIVRQSQMPSSTIIVISDGFLALTFWHDALPPGTDTSNLLLDAHQYIIFNDAQLALNHSSKLSFACSGWSQQTEVSMNPSTGFGNFLCGEWSQADTDCATYLNNVGIGSRWEGTLDTGNASTSVLTPTCYTGGLPSCECGPANADPSSYSQGYKNWLKMNAEAQIQSFEKGWGWFYWTWYTENATQWSWKTALGAGIVPQDAAKTDWQCGDEVLNFASLPETY